MSPAPLPAEPPVIAAAPPVRVMRLEQRAGGPSVPPVLGASRDVGDTRPRGRSADVMPVNPMRLAAAPDAPAIVDPLAPRRRGRHESVPGGNADLRERIDGMPTWLGEARRMLMDRYTVAEVAAAVGFNRATNFSRSFRVATGVTPQKWVRECGGTRQ